MKILKFLKSAWQGFIKVIMTKEWLFSYPATLFIIVLFISHSLWALAALALWVITIIYNTDGE
jgi:uncharacterized membrane protein